MKTSCTQRIREMALESYFVYRKCMGDRDYQKFINKHSPFLGG